MTKETAASAESDDVTLCPSDAQPCTLKCYRGWPSRPCDPPKPAANDDAADQVAA